MRTCRAKALCIQSAAVITELQAPAPDRGSSGRWEPWLPWPSQSGRNAAQHPDSQAKARPPQTVTLANHQSQTVPQSLPKGK